MHEKKRNNLRYFRLFIGIVVCFTNSIRIAFTQDLGMTNEISQHEVTWIFAEEHQYGQFANGDYWVLGPVTITSITPDFDGTHHGWEVNPTPGTANGFDVRVEAFNTDLVPSLPYTTKATESIIKTVSRTPFNEDLRPSLLFAAVLTVVEQVPPGNGAEVFRPPYVGTSKPYYKVEDIKRELIPALKAEVPKTPSFEAVVGWFENVQMDHILYGRGASRSRPLNNLPDYGSAIAQRTASAALRLMVEGNEEEYMKAMIAYLQCGIDYYHIVDNGGIWNRGSGEAPGHKLPIVFFVTLLGDELMKSKIHDLRFYEDYLVYYGTDGFALWGDWGWGSEGTSQVSETAYWNNISTGGGSRTHADPYGYIDGGQIPGEYYQFCCTSLPFKGTALALLLMPELRKIWNPLALFDYVDRWVTHGTWTQPDPCAAAGNSDEYGITWGPDPNNPGDCIKDGVGRFPLLHGTKTNSGHYGSGFHNSMWDTYRHTAGDAPATLPFASIIYPRNGDYIARQVKLSATAYGINGIESVQFKLNGSDLGQKVTNAADFPFNTYSIVWNTGNYPGKTALISALATDSMKNTFESTPIEIVMDPDESDLPGDFRFRVLPNPFSTDFRVDFMAPRAGRYEVTLYNLKGMKVATIMDKELPQGPFSLQITGLKIPAGVYFCTLKNNKAKETLKVMYSNN